MGTSPSSVVDAFLASAKQTAQPGEPVELDDRNCDVDGHCRTGPDTVVALLADEIIGAAFDHARELRCVMGFYCICSGTDKSIVQSLDFVRSVLRWR